MTPSCFLRNRYMKVDILLLSYFHLFKITNMSQQLAASRFCHNAPAGTKFKSILDAGRTLLRERYQGFLEGTSHALIPSLFVNCVTEEVGQDGKVVPGPDIDPAKLVGTNHWKRGEDFEIIIFRRFEQILCSHDSSSLLLPQCHILWKGFKIDGF